MLGRLGLTTAAFLLLSAVPAFAGVVWRLDSNSAPTYLRPGAQARIIATAGNLGDSEVIDRGAHRVRLTDRLPANLQVPSSVPASAIEGKLEVFKASEAESTLECTLEEAQRKEISCQTAPTTRAIAPYHELKIVIPVEVATGAATGEENVVSVSGGELPSGQEVLPAAPLSQPITVHPGQTPFGVEHYELSSEEADGTIDAHASSHPFQLTTRLDLNETLAPGGEGQVQLQPAAPALAKDLTFELPPGLLGNPTRRAVAQCSDLQFSTIGENNVNGCPADSAIGVAMITLNLLNPPLGVFTEAVPVFNLVPAPGEPARFGLEDTKVPIILDTSVRTGGDYGVDVEVNNTTQVGQLLATQVTLWGEPSNASHDNSRGWACIRQTEVNGETCAAPAERSSVPFLTLPGACTGGLVTAVNGEAWSGGRLEAEYELQDGLGEPLAGLEGCTGAPFSPALTVSPVEEGEGEAPGAIEPDASTPAGMNVTVALPAEADGLGESAVRSTTVILPEGVQLDPSAANGLQACSEAQVGYEGQDEAPDPLSPGAPQPLRFSTAPASLPGRVEGRHGPDHSA